MAGTSADGAAAGYGRIVVFRVGAIAAGVDIHRVVGILRPVPATRVPLAPACLEGVINVKHDVVPVVDLGCRLGLPAEPGGPAEAARIVLVEDQGQVVGLRVDSVMGIHSLELSAVAPPSGRDGDFPVGYTRGVWSPAGQEGERVAILDLARVLDVWEQRGAANVTALEEGR